MEVDRFFAWGLLKAGEMVEGVVLRRSGILIPIQS